MKERPPMPGQDKISTRLMRLHKASPAGFAIALHVRFTSPRYLFQSYPREWLDTYSRRGLVLHDPTVRWGFENTGSVRWSELVHQDGDGVMNAAATTGLRYGVTVSIDQKGSRSMASFARSDREATDEEITAFTSDISELHNLTLGVERLSPSVHATLKQMSIYLTHE